MNHVLVPSLASPCYGEREDLLHAIFEELGDGRVKWTFPGVTWTNGLVNALNCCLQVHVRPLSLPPYACVVF